MGKRSNFERNERDFYPTPFEAVVPLIPHLDQHHYVEPCAGDGALIGHLNSFGVMCTWACDIEPQSHTVSQGDALKLNRGMDCKMIITNPPWDVKILHPMIDHFRQIAPTWLLFYSDWMFTKQASGWNQPTDYLKYCHKIVSVGRVQWFPGTKNTGKDNCAWYLFKDTPGTTIFHGPKVATTKPPKRSNKIV